jgi:hypothetical protein
MRVPGRLRHEPAVVSVYAVWCTSVYALVPIARLRKAAL